MSGELPTTKRASRWRSAFLVAGLALLAGVGAWLVHRSGPPQIEPSPMRSTDDSDPRRTYSGPYRNVSPDVQYVGDAKCAGCHEDIARSYAHHPMGQSLVPIADLLDRQQYAADVNNPFTALGRRFQVDRQGKQVWHRQAVFDDAGRPVVEMAQEVQWAIGSGRKGYSYLTERDGYLLQTPISWFTQQKRWDLSPGFVPEFLAGRVVPASCLSCHTNRVRERPEHPDRFETPVFEGYAIGCERCHGPGELHVQGDWDHTIVNPVRLSPALRDAVCEQCHLEGEARLLRSGRGPFDYRPGLPLAEFLAVMVPERHAGESARAVNHVEQMYQSKCFQRPVGPLKMGCITCHDPHVFVGPAEREAHYRAACLKCHDEEHGQRGCTVPLPQRRQTNPADSCIACHMPHYATSDIPHTASTDHRILRRPADEQPAPPTDPDSARFVDFYRDHFPQGDSQAERNLGLALLRMMNSGHLRPERHGERALRLLESAVAQFPQDVEVREAKVQVLLRLKRPAEALSEARAALAKRPGSWRLLSEAAGTAQAEGQPELALDYWRRAVEINPCVPEYQVALVALLIRLGKLDEARVRCRKLVDLDPFDVSGRQMGIGFLLQDGNKAEARSEFEVIRRLKPPDLAKREEWFREQLR
jgi:Flp pilus assembly protein TadD